MRDAGHDGAAAGPKTSGSLTGTAKLTSSSRYADIISKVRARCGVVLLSPHQGCHYSGMVTEAQPVATGQRGPPAYHCPSKLSGSRQRD